MTNVIRLAAVAAAVAAALTGCSETSEPALDAATESATVSTSVISAPSGQVVLQGAILQMYIEAGESTSPLGSPIGDEQAGPNGGRYTKFQGGVIYWSPRTGAHIVWGGIRRAWEDSGGADGPLGYPSSDERPVPGGWQSDFEHGSITYAYGQPQIQTQ